MPSVCFYFQVHQPRRVKRYRVFDVGYDHNYFNDESESNLSNRKILRKVAHKCYLPTNAVILDLLKKYPKFRVAYSFSGVVLDQFAEFAPEVLESFQNLVKTGRVEILSETYYHSLSYLYSKEEFQNQVRLHRRKIRDLFNYEPKVFRNTELIYNNDLAGEVKKMGYKGILAEGAPHILGWRSPYFVYAPPAVKDFGLLLRSFALSDDISFRFSAKWWPDYPLTAGKFADWVSSVNGAGQVINLFMDYETFGEHQWADTGIFEFLKHLPGEILKNPDNDFVTPGEAIARYRPMAELDIPHFISWADVERDLSAWLSNPMQNDAIRKTYDLAPLVLKSRDQKLIEDWRRLQTSDHFYYMCTKWFADGDVHKYFNPYESPYDAFIAFMNAVHDVQLRSEEANS